ncbi:MAG TPA: LLM class flavin-dependent oxidoreductase [Candidatus Dormibacteraeota bacterium]|nr:LLM class flavin-dependent oxidoreductase [Candidatus Dormibacteraeota bacterium]
MTQVGIMIEGQEGLSWERWRRICADAENLGFASLRRSDHLISLMNAPVRDCVECWTSLALAAEWTKRIEFGPMVSPMTFRFPSVLAKQAAAVDALSGGRLILGVGAGWNENEHGVFDIPFYTPKERFDRLEAGIKTMREIWSSTNPKPARNPIPLLIGGKGERRTLPLAAREAAEWNYSTLNVDGIRERVAILERCCRDIGREPSSIKRSVMTSFIIGRNRAELLERAARAGEVIPALGAMTPEQIVENRKEPWFVGTPEQIAQRMREVSALGIGLFMLQHFALDDSDALHLLAEEVLPAVA